MILDTRQELTRYFQLLIIDFLSIKVVSDNLKMESAKSDSSAKKK